MKTKSAGIYALMCTRNLKTSLKDVSLSDDATFHVNGPITKHDVRICGEKNPHATIEHTSVSPKEKCSVRSQRIIFMARFLWGWET